MLGRVFFQVKRPYSIRQPSGVYTARGSDKFTGWGKRHGRSGVLRLRRPSWRASVVGSRRIQTVRRRKGAVGGFSCRNVLCSSASGVVNCYIDRSRSKLLFLRSILEMSRRYRRLGPEIGDAILNKQPLSFLTKAADSLHP